MYAKQYYDLEIIISSRTVLTSAVFIVIYKENMVFTEKKA
jgi:hypothetical protein